MYSVVLPLASNKKSFNANGSQQKKQIYLTEKFRGKLGKFVILSVLMSRHIFHQFFGTMSLWSFGVSQILFDLKPISS